MKKLLLIFALLAVSLVLTACRIEDPITCQEGFIVHNDECIPDQTPIESCIEGYNLMDGACILDTPIDTCEDGHSVIDGECVLDTPTLICEEGYIMEDNECIKEQHKMFEMNGDQREYFNVPYKRVDDVTQYLDIYFPDEITDDMPVFIYVHGGGFLWGNKDLINEDYRINHVSYKDRLNDLGYIFISVGYQKVQNNTYPCLEGQISDVKDAIKWVKRNHRDLHSSDENIGLWGLSAGGALALAAALNPDENYQTFYPEYSSEVRYVIDFYGITDIYDFYNIPNYPNLSESDRNTEYWRVKTHTNITSEDESNYPLIKAYVDRHSPLYNYTTTDTIIAIHHGNNDNQVSFEANAQTLYDTGILLGNDIYLTTYEGKGHGFWWDTEIFYYNLLEQVVSEVLLFSAE